MKVSKEENKKLSDAIDQMQSALDVFIEMYNDSEEDKLHIQLDADVIELIEKAKNVYGSEVVNEKVNTIIKEVLTFLPLENFESQIEEQAN
ncbi:atypical membrane-integrating protein (Mistic protein) [Calidifontibacillus erzurumensis]|uniref:Atypical membrane-integrating protein (Mistic protein) n=1 Tax=Calidifontibacillus erzurumensis TaxID=2741433 RepID=A0A8J8KAS2_9BACI|nr:atypical membrane-integrating protein (Mistic protein) [Calidifontibacillus erzurumensis]NSL50902.1 atypical membrane-integrating protein (Mistic protein) [Calidifontibacillus erzurumensis]